MSGEGGGWEDSWLVMGPVVMEVRCGTTECMGGLQYDGIEDALYKVKTRAHDGCVTVTFVEDKFLENLVNTQFFAGASFRSLDSEEYRVFDDLKGLPVFGYKEMQRALLGRECLQQDGDENPDIDLECPHCVANPELRKTVIIDGFVCGQMKGRHCVKKCAEAATGAPEIKVWKLNYGKRRDCFVQHAFLLFVLPTHAYVVHMICKGLAYGAYVLFHGGGYEFQRQQFFRFTRQKRSNGKDRPLLPRGEFDALVVWVGEQGELKYLHDILKHVSENCLQEVAGEHVKCGPGTCRRVLDSIMAAAPALCMQGDLNDRAVEFEAMGNGRAILGDAETTGKLLRIMPLVVDICREWKSRTLPLWARAYAFRLAEHARLTSVAIGQLGDDEGVQGSPPTPARVPISREEGV